MKKTVALGLYAVANLLCAAQAAGPSLNTTTGGDIGLQASTYRYEEVVNDRTFMTTQGTKLGVTASGVRALESDDWRGWFVGADGRIAGGYVDYEGSGTKSGVSDNLVEFRVTGGRDFAMNGYVLAGFAGVGMRKLYNDLRGQTSTGATGYRRDSTYLYLPLGVTHRFAWNEQARVSTTLEYDYLLEGSQLSYTTDFGALNDARNVQRKGYGMRLSSAYEMRQWSFGVFYNYWNIDDSERATYILLPYLYTVIEPKNSTREFGVAIKYRFD